MGTLSSNLTSFSDVTENAPLSPAYLNSKLGPLDKNINEINSSRTVTVTDGTITGTFTVGSAEVRIGTTSNHLFRIETNDTGRWDVGTAGDLVPVTDLANDVGGAASSVRTVYTGAVASLRTHATPTTLQAGELGLVYQSSGMSIMIRSGDTIYDLGKSASTYSQAVV